MRVSINMVKPNDPEGERFYDQLELKPTSIKNLYETGEELIFEPDLDTILCITGTSGSGKDTVMVQLQKEGHVHHVRTATTRKRRFQSTEKDPDLVSIFVERCQSVDEYLGLLESLNKEGYISPLEPEDAYIWMRWKRSDESEQEYFDSLISEYGLVEFNNHYGNLYGMPASSLESNNGDGFQIIRTNIDGVVTLKQKLRGIANFISIGLLPDNLAMIRSAIIMREGLDASELDIEKRYKEDVDSLRLFNQVHYVLVNSRFEVDGMPGLDHTMNIMRMLITEFKGRYSTT